LKLYTAYFEGQSRVMDRIQLKEEPERKNTGMILPDLLY